MNKKPIPPKGEVVKDSGYGGCLMTLLIPALVILTLILPSIVMASRWQEKASEIYSFFNKTEYKYVSKQIVAIFILETGYGKSLEHTARKNLLGIRTHKTINPTPCKSRECTNHQQKLHDFPSYEVGYHHLLDHFRWNHFSVRPSIFADDLYLKGYVHDNEYTGKIYWIVRNKLQFLK